MTAVYYCPRCRSAPRPLSDWSTHPSMGYAVCLTCRRMGYNGDVDRYSPPPDARQRSESTGEPNGVPRREDDVEGGMGA